MVLHPASFFTWHITSCLYSLQVSLHPVLIDYICISCSRIHYMLPNPLHDPESITCSRIHYMLPNSLHAPESITCSRIHPESITCDQYSPLSINQWAAGRAIGSDAAIAVSPGWRRSLARLAHAINSPSSVGFNLQDNIPACSDRTCSKQMRWLPARGPCTIEVEQCKWWLGQVVLGISRARMSLLNIHAILPRTKI